MCAKNYHIRLTFLFLATSIVSNHAMILPPTQRLHQTHIKSELSHIIQSPHIGYIANATTEIFIIGTSHFSCNSASEVKSLISTVKPDGVVLELDPERCLRLTKQSFGIDATGKVTASTSTDAQGELLYGADFVAAINACQELDIPLFLGDEYTQETRGRLMRRIWELDAYSPQALFRSLFPKGAHTKKGSAPLQSRIDVVQTFVRDPRKLTPLVVTTSPPFMMASAFSLFNEQQTAIAYDGSATISPLFDASLSNSIELGFAIIASFLLSCLLFNNVIVERDLILAASTVRASNVLRSLKENRSIRKRWTFKTTAQDQKKTTSQSSSLSQEDKMSINNSEKRLVLKDPPLFTLKTPIQKGMIRRLNLFEPRWLKMMDQLKLNSSPSQRLQLGCVRCTNKFYSATAIDGVEGRYADIIFETTGNMADVIEVKEGKRPVSGDRRLSVILQGGDSFVLDKESVSLCDDGYTVASTVEPISLEDQDSTLYAASHEAFDEVVRIVVVVGLLHGNGVVSLLSDTS
ncbi:hypothetical protein HJC23_000842 [Cyclotella cryptica]|uniref:Uncharacterized protein n=1 Tax=Cyclotella cryptica TaxID=29204 RepID=A0ABD3NYE5_9STRA